MNIHDGTGSGNKCKVTHKNQISAVAVSVGEATHISSTEQGAYAIEFERTLAAASTTEVVGFLKIYR